MFTCDHCNKNYKFKRNLVRHIIERHGETKFYKCSVQDCSVKFRRRGYLKQHLKNSHGFDNEDARRYSYEVEGNENLSNQTACADNAQECMQTGSRSPYIPECEDISEDEDIDFDFLSDFLETLTENELNMDELSVQYSDKTDNVQPNYLEELCADDSIGDHIDNQESPTDDVVQMDNETCCGLISTGVPTDNSEEDVIYISDEGENTCRDIAASHLRKKTEVYVLTFTKYSGYIGDKTVFEEMCVDKHYYEHFDA